MPDPAQPGAPRGFCFMVMPFGERAIGLDKPEAPKKVDFNALWEKSFKPALEQLGYIAVRGDDGSLTENIVRDILESLTLSDLVVADITATNGNVFYEVGVRHAVPGDRPCVMLAASWAQPPFDVSGTRQLRYPFPAGTPTDEDYEKVRQLLVAELNTMKKFGTPMSVVAKYPHTQFDDAPSFRDRLKELNEFQAEVCKVRLASKTDRQALARQLLDRYARDVSTAHYLTRSVALELVMIARDTLNWDDVLSIVRQLPANVRDVPQVMEQEQLALAKNGDVLGSIARLKALIALHGPTPERHGLLAGRWKQKLEAARTDDDRAEALDRLIEHYTLGMDLDLNEYYCSCNLPRRLRQRGGEGDERAALSIIPLVQRAARLAYERRPDDRWAVFTLLGTAVDAGDATEARRALDLVRKMKPADWEVETTLKDVELSLSQQPAAVQAELRPVAEALRKLAPPRP